MIRLNLTPVFQARGIENPYNYLVRAGFSRHTASNLANNNLLSIHVDHIEKLCTVLVCEPNDLFVFTPKKDQYYPPDHPLLNLIQQDIPDFLATMPLKQLKELTKNIGKEKL